MSEYDATDVIAQLLRNHEADLKRYIVCRSGDPSTLDDVYERLGNELAQAAFHGASEAPSLPALAYATVRRLAVASADVHHLEQLEWETTPRHQLPRYGEALDRLRGVLDPVAAELLELRYARGLSVDEVGFVLGLSSSVVETALAEGATAAVVLAAELTGTETPIEKLVQDAFRPRTSVEPGRQRQPARAPRLAPGTTLGGRFEVQSTVETGPLASTYVATDVSVPGLSVVVHLLHRPVSTTSARAGVQGKLRLLDSVVHSSVDRTLGQGWHSDRFWYASPWHRGHTLAQLVVDGPVSPTEAIEIFAPIARGLAALHDNGVVHRNISAEGILLVEAGSQDVAETLPIVTDFDTWILGEDLAEREPPFIAPEVARRLLEGSSPGIGAQSEDIFSLGMALLCSLEPGLRPAGDMPWGSLLSSRAKGAIEIPDSSRIAAFARILEKALSTDPGARPTAAEFAGALEKAESKVHARRERRSLAPPIAALFAALALLLVVYFVRESRLKMIRETSEGVEAKVLQEELTAEKTRTKELESVLERLKAASKPPNPQ